MGDAARKRLRLLEKGASDVPGVEVLRGQHLALGCPVEVRMAEEPGREGVAEELVREMVELAALDHPSFPPVLERGLSQGRYYYAVPLRTHHPLVDQVRDAGFPLRDRGRVVLALVSALSALHLKGILPPPLDSRELGWDPEIGVLRFRHHRLRAGGFDPFGTLLPQDWKDPTPANQVRQWAALSYWVLTRGKAPFEGGEEVPLRGRVRRVHLDLAHLVDICLFGAEDERPGNGPELAALVQLLPGPIAVPGGGPGGGDPPEDARSKLDVSRSLADLRQQGKIPRVVEAFEGQLGSLRDRLGEVDLPSLPGLEGLGWERLSRPSPAWLVVGGLGLLLLLWLAFREPGGEPPPVRVGRTDLGALGVSAEDLRSDPYLERLAKMRSVTRSEFSEVFGLLRTLGIQGRLPASLRDPARLVEIHKQFQSDPDAACGALEGMLDELRELRGGP